MVFRIAHCMILINFIITINCLNENPTRNNSAIEKGDFKVGVLVSVRYHSPGKKNTRNLECGKVGSQLKCDYYRSIS